MAKTDYLYKNKVDASNRKKTEELLKILPLSVGDYIHAISINTASRTQLAYAQDLLRFFDWFRIAVPELNTRPMRSLGSDILSQINAKDIEEYSRNLLLDEDRRNSKSSIGRKLSALNSYFKYLVAHDEIPSNPCERVMRPNVKKDKPIIALTEAEAKRFLDAVYYGSGAMTERQRKYLENTRLRDFAIIILLMNTGIRRSECVGLNIEDYNSEEHTIQVFRKGEKYQRISLNTEAESALNDYLIFRKQITSIAPADSHALFLSLQKRRLEPASINAIIRTYALAAGIQKKITPHIFRKTFGTTLYQKTRDIYLVANALGHSSVQTTTAHYVTDRDDGLRDHIEKLSFWGQK